MLADVYAEAFEEAEFYGELFDAAFEDAEHTLESLAFGPERDLLATLDLLVIDASPDRRELRQGLGAKPQAASMALLQLGEVELVAEAMRDSGHAGVIRGAALLPSPALLERGLRALEVEGARPWLDLCAAYGVCPPRLERWLRCEEPGIACAALRAARQAPAYLVEPLLRDPRAEVRDEALVTALVLQLPAAFGVLRSRALDPDGPSPLAMQLYAALGTPHEFAELASLLEVPALRMHALFALGFSGDLATIPTLLPYLEHADARVAKLAFEAIANISGLELAETEGGELAFADELHEAVDDLPLPDAEQVERWWSSLQRPPAQRYLRGAPFDAQAMARCLELAPLRLRHTHALSLAIRTHGQHVVDTRALTAVQHSQIQMLRARDPVLSNPYLA